MKKKKLILKTETVRILMPTQLQKAAGGITWTCLGTDCTCLPTYDPDGCGATGGYTRCLCTTVGSQVGC